VLRGSKKVKKAEEESLGLVNKMAELRLHLMVFGLEYVKH
jgi:hypothetical protein